MVQFPFYLGKHLIGVCSNASIVYRCSLVKCLYPILCRFSGYGSKVILSHFKALHFRVESSGRDAKKWYLWGVKVRGYIVSLLLILVPVLVRGQEISVSAAQNFLTSAPPIARLVQEPRTFQAFDASISWETSQTEAARLLGSPRLGLGVSYANLGSCRCIPGSRLGDTFSIYGSIKHPILRLGPFMAGYNIELGTAFMSHPYHVYDNPGNLLYGGPITIHVKGGFFALVQVSPRLGLEADIDFRHNSSCRLIIPNAGVNAVSCSLGARYRIGNGTLKPGEHRPQDDPLDRKFRFSIFAGGGIHRCMAEFNADKLLPPEERQSSYTPWFKGSIGADFVWRYSRVTSSGLQAELHYLSNTEALVRSDNALYGPAERSYSPFAPGLAVIQDLYFGSFTAGVGVGAYLYKKVGVHEDHGRLYQKVWLKYYPPSLHGLFAGICLRAHKFNQADYLEFSIGKIL